jgi:hypothetical protein
MMGVNAKRGGWVAKKTNNRKSSMTKDIGGDDEVERGGA